MSSFTNFTANTNRLEIPLSGKYVQLISRDGESFNVPIEYVKLCEHIQETIDISEEEECPTFDLINISTSTLVVIIGFLEEYTKEPFKPLTKPLPTEGISSVLPIYYNELLKIPMVPNNTWEEDSSSSASAGGSSRPSSGTSLIELLAASNFLRITSLRQLIIAKLADSVRNQNLPGMLKLFGLPNSIPSWDDLERLRKEHSYAFPATNQ